MSNLFKVFNSEKYGEILLSKNFSPVENTPGFLLTYLTDVNKPESISSIYFVPVDLEYATTKQEFIEMYENHFKNLNLDVIGSIIENNPNSVSQSETDTKNNFIHPAPENEQ
tara:strand:- start:13709 stop:14044 length:336 start_codon:yes stop_codon:yes gene_type:complete